MKPDDQKLRRSGQYFNRKHDHRDPYEKDLARLIHCAAFRRLQAKTQVLGIGEGDFHRTRLTHSMEVAQIGRGIIRNLRNRICVPQPEALLSEDLIFTIGLAHDLGHPPFGHGGEIALNYCMRDHGGFEGNGQTLRILSRLEAHTEDYGLDMTRRTMLGILKYPTSYSKLHKTGKNPEPKDISQLKRDEWKPPKCFHDSEQDVVDWILSPLSSSDQRAFTKYSTPKDNKHGKPTEKSLDASIMNLADDIAYGVHDLEDAIALKLVSIEIWESIRHKIPDQWMEDYDLPSNFIKQLFGSSSERKRSIGALVNAFIVNTEISPIDYYESDLLKYSVNLTNDAKAVLNLIRRIVDEHVIKIPEVQTLEYRGQQIVGRIFDAMASNPKQLLKKSFADKWDRLNEEAARMRVICDYVSGMTDEYATRMYERLFMPRQGTVFQRL